jgi:hypothetical protein
MTEHMAGVLVAKVRAFHGKTCRRSSMEIATMRVR